MMKKETTKSGKINENTNLYLINYNLSFDNLVR
jgi:hypothetical protein